MADDHHHVEAGVQQWMRRGNEQGEGVDVAALQGGRGDADPGDGGLAPLDTGDAGGAAGVAGVADSSSSGGQRAHGHRRTFSTVRHASQKLLRSLDLSATSGGAGSCRDDALSDSASLPSAAAASPPLRLDLSAVQADNNDGGSEMQRLSRYSQGSVDPSFVRRRNHSRARSRLGSTDWFQGVVSQLQIDGCRDASASPSPSASLRPPRERPAPASGSAVHRPLPPPSGYSRPHSSRGIGGGGGTGGGMFSLSWMNPFRARDVDSDGNNAAARGRAQSVQRSNSAHSSAATTDALVSASSTALSDSSLSAHEMHDVLRRLTQSLSEARPYLYFSGRKPAANMELLEAYGITHVVNAAGVTVPNYFEGKLLYMRLYVQDGNERISMQEMMSFFYPVANFIDDARRSGGRVLLHCHQGISRSSALVLSYLMLREGVWPLDEAVRQVVWARPTACPNPAFLDALTEMEMRVYVGRCRLALQLGVASRQSLPSPTVAALERQRQKQERLQEAETSAAATAAATQASGAVGPSSDANGDAERGGDVASRPTEDALYVAELYDSLLVALPAGDDSCSSSASTSAAESIGAAKMAQSRRRTESAPTPEPPSSPMAPAAADGSGEKSTPTLSAAADAAAVSPGAPSEVIDEGEAQELLKLRLFRMEEHTASSLSHGISRGIRHRLLGSRRSLANGIGASAGAAAAAAAAVGGGCGAGGSSNNQHRRCDGNRSDGSRERAERSPSALPGGRNARHCQSNHCAPRDDDEHRERDARGVDGGRPEQERRQAADADAESDEDEYRLPVGELAFMVGKAQHRVRVTSDRCYVMHTPFDAQFLQQLRSTFQGGTTWLRGTGGAFATRHRRAMSVGANADAAVASHDAAAAVPAAATGSTQLFVWHGARASDAALVAAMRLAWNIAVTECCYFESYEDKWHMWDVLGEELAAWIAERGALLSSSSLSSTTTAAAVNSECGGGGGTGTGAGGGSVDAAGDGRRGGSVEGAEARRAMTAYVMQPRVFLSVPSVPICLVHEHYEPEAFTMHLHRSRNFLSRLHVW